MAVDVWAFPARRLEEVVDQFLTEKMVQRGMSVDRAADYRANLIGLAVLPGVVGFTRFLQCGGVEAPTLQNLTSAAVGAYYEFLIQHHGALRSAGGMRALRAFWIWCKRNGLTGERKMPADLKADGVLRPWRVQISISESE